MRPERNVKVKSQRFDLKENMRINRLEKMINLEGDLKEAIRKENYEFAALLRDEIKNLEGKV